MREDAPSDAVARVTVRRLLSTDSLEELTAMLNEAFQERALQGLDYMAVGQDVDGTRARIMGGECYVAVCEGRIVGTGTIHGPRKKKGSPWYRHPEVAGISQLAVHPTCQGIGIAGRLMSVCECRALEMGARACCLDTSEQAENLVAWYERCGYRVVDHVRHTHTNYRSVVMYKHIGDGPAIRVAAWRRLAYGMRMRLRRGFERLPRRWRYTIARVMGRQYPR